MKMKRGFSIIEIIIACAIFLGTVTAFVAASEILRDLQARAEDKTAAALLLEEGAEAILLLRDLGWDAHFGSLTLESPYSLYWDGDSYELSGSDVEIGGYLRRVVFSEVLRDGGGAYSSSGTVDPDSLKAEIEILTIDGESIETGAMLVHNIHE